MSGIKEINIKIKTLKFGQTRKYGDSEYEYELEVKGMSEFDVKRFCTKILQQCNQTYEEWDKKDANSYFRGYYKFEMLERSDLGEARYKYFVHSPSTH